MNEQDIFGEKRRKLEMFSYILCFTNKSILKGTTLNKF